jgi:hypothetical protein
MFLRKQPPIAGQPTRTVRTHQLHLGAELVERDGSTTVVAEVGADGPHIPLRLTNGTTGTFRRERRWRVITPPNATAGAPVVAV